jgi:hypothetical protein
MMVKLVKLFSFLNLFGKTLICDPDHVVRRMKLFRFAIDAKFQVRTSDAFVPETGNPDLAGVAVDATFVYGTFFGFAMRKNFE